MKKKFPQKFKVVKNLVLGKKWKKNEIRSLRKKKLGKKYFGIFSQKPFVSISK